MNYAVTWYLFILLSDCYSYLNALNAAQTHGIQMLWKNDGSAQNINPSSSTDVLAVRLPLKVVNWASNKLVLQIVEGREIR